MKTLILILLSFTAFAQQPAVMDPVLVQDLDFTLVRPEFGKVYRVMLRKDHALLAEGIADSTWVTICYGCQITQPTEPKPDIVVTTDSSPFHSRNAYYGNWRHASGSTWLKDFHEQTGSYTQTVNDSLVIEFDGYRIQWFTEKLNNHGMAEIKIDGKVIEFKEDGKTLPGLDLYAPGNVNNSQLVFDSQDHITLDNGPHKLVIKPTGQKNPAATQDNVIHDYVKFYKKQ